LPQSALQRAASIQGDTRQDLELKEGEYKMKLAVKTALAALFIGGTASAGFALADVEDARALSEATISLTDAIAAAESHTGGTAYEAQIEDDSFSPEFEVGIIADDLTYEVRIDGNSGEVISAREDRDD
jgi:uncharacterized membrane protein YkoI